VILPPEPALSTRKRDPRTTRKPAPAAPPPPRPSARRRGARRPVREVVAWHFDPATGLPSGSSARAAWAGTAARGPAVRGPRPLRPLRGRLAPAAIPPLDPRGLAGRPAFVFETGGSTESPRARRHRGHARLLAVQRGLSETGSRGARTGCPWVPRPAAAAPRRRAPRPVRGGICFHIDMDPAG